MPLNNQSTNKKPYESPQLFIYGNIRELTMNSNISTSKFDNFNPNAAPNNKTSTG
jgi:hypothetical protein